MMRLRTDREPYPGRLKTEHDAIRCREPVRAPAGEHDRMHPFDDRRWIQEVGLSRSRATAAYVNATDRAVAGNYDGGPRQPAVAVRSVVPYLKTLDHPLILPTCQHVWSL